jgi:hypothetical protein
MLRNVRLMLEGQAILLALQWYRGVPEAWEPEFALLITAIVIVAIALVQLFWPTREKADA